MHAAVFPEMVGRGGGEEPRKEEHHAQ
jgi:hypothetical protein